MVANKSFGKRRRKRKEKKRGKNEERREEKRGEGVAIQTENIMIRREKRGEEN